MNAAELLHTPLLRHRAAYIDGQFLPTEGTALAVRDPASGHVLAELPRYGAAAARAAVDAAARQLHAVASLEQRAGWLRAIAQAHADNREALARIITAENGKPLAEARAEVDYSAAFYRAAASRVPELRPHALGERLRGHEWVVHHRPAGVAGIITPWNFPLAMLAKKASAAIAAGAPMVIKPAEKTPLSVIALFHLLEAVGLPKGFANLVFGDAAAIGRVLCEHPAVRVVSFTGSTAVGKLLASQAAQHVKRLALELGGNAPFIVFEDADIDGAVEHLMANKFRCAGQTCVCANRVYVHRGVAKRLAERLVSSVEQLRLGAGYQEGVTVGPLIDRAAFAKVAELVADALGRGARLACGRRVEVPAEGQATLYPPTVLTGVDASMRCTREELFGPVVALIEFSQEEEVVEAANATEYGLAAYVFSRDLARLERVAAALRFGHVGVNCAVGPTAEAPFGGMKQSGIGREGGLEGILEYVELQVLARAAAS